MQNTSVSISQSALIQTRKSRGRGIVQEDKDFGYWGVDFQAYSSRAKELGLFLDRRPVRALPAAQETGSSCPTLSGHAQQCDAYKRHGAVPEVITLFRDSAARNSGKTMDS